MRIAITATGPSLDADVDPRFGRCQYFIIVDPDNMDFEAVENSSMMAGSGAGISTGQMIAGKGVEVVLTGNCGPNAYQTLSAAGLQVITGVMGRIRDVIQGYKAGQFQGTAQPNVGAHFGVGATPGMGRGMGRGKGMMPVAEPASQGISQEQEIEALKSQNQMLMQQMEEMKRRVEELGRNK